MPDSSASHANTALREAVAASGWTAVELLRALNSTAAEVGLTVRYERTALAHWLRGSRPPPLIGDLLAETLGRRLGRPLSAVDLGLLGGRPTGPLGGHPVEELAHLDTAPARPYRLRSVLPSWPTHPLPPPTRPGARRVGTVQVQAVAALAADAARHHNRFGGQVARALLLTPLTRHVPDWLRAPAGETDHRALLVHASALCVVAARTYVDDGRHGTAQRYLHLARQLAEQAQDAPARALALRALSAQATLLGHHAHALELADAALMDATAGPPEVRAYVLVQQGICAAHLRDARRSHAAFDAAAALLSDSPPQQTGPGHDPGRTSYPRAAFHYQRALAETALGRTRQALAAFERSLLVRAPDEHRPLALTRLHIARLLAMDGRLQQARHHADEAWSLHGTLRSAVVTAERRRVDAAVAQGVRPRAER
ncbi:hypothetical protein [Streptomyces sp. NPDC048282]|uniref:hypothetical protein n=1 Tax=Streptomyces sp. NPDC048282 TaxID=3365528 RepID=UPI00371B01BD